MQVRLYMMPVTRLRLLSACDNRYALEFGFGSFSIEARKQLLAGFALM